MAEKRYFSSESVTEGHPDKVCDKISDSVLDAILAEDPMARVACETSMTTGLILVMGEITTSSYVDIENIARTAVREVGYDRAKYGFDADSCAVLNSIHSQSPDIAMGVNKSLEARGGADDDRRVAGQIDILIEKSPEKRAIPIARKVRNEAGRIVPRKKRHTLNLELNEQQARLVANDG